MDQITLFTSQNFDAISLISKIFHIIYEINNFTYNISSFHWNYASELPNLLYNSTIYDKSQIVSFLKSAFDPNFDLEDSEKIEAEMLEEFCISRLHPATEYVKWMEETSLKEFFYPQGNFLWKILMMPASKLRFVREKRRVLEWLSRQHNITDKHEALLQADKAHKLLSERLGNKPFFFNKPGRSDYPRSTDIVVYAYLVEELFSFRGDFHIKESLINYGNLMQFVGRMEKIIKNKIRVNKLSKWDYCYFGDSSSIEEFYPPKIYLNVVRTSSKRCEISQENDSKIQREIWSLLGILLGFLIIREIKF